MPYDCVLLSNSETILTPLRRESQLEALIASSRLKMLRSDDIKTFRLRRSQSSPSEQHMEVCEDDDLVLHTIFDQNAL